MVSLIDIGPATGSVSIRGKDVDVFGLSAEAIARILLAFPEIRVMLTQELADTKTAMMSLIQKFPEAAGLILAAATGADITGDKAALDAHLASVNNLVIGEQFDVLSKMLELTFPRGVRNFLDGAQGLFAQASGGRGWAPGTTSLAQSSGASPQAAANETAGDQPLVN
jgi:hypothetical protein